MRLLLAAYVLIAAIACVGTPAGSFDDVLPLVQSRWIARGLHAHVDFFSFYPPLSYYVEWAACAVVGQTIVAQRLLHILLYLVILVAADRLLRREFPQAHYVPAYVVLLLAVSTKLLVAPWPGTAVSLLALFAYLSGPTSRRHLLAAGLLTSVAFFYRVNFGAYVGLAIGACIALDWLRFDGKARPDWRLAASYLGSGAVSGIAFCLFFYGAHIGDAIQQSIVILAQVHTRGLRFLELSDDMGWALGVLFPCGWYCVRMVLDGEPFPRKALVPLVLGAGLVATAQYLHADPHVATVVVLGEIAAVLLLQIGIYRLQRFEFCFLLFFACSLHYFLSRADAWHAAILIGLLPFFVPYLTPSRGSTLVLCAAAGCFVLTLPYFLPDADNFSTGINVLLHGQLTSRASDFEHLSRSPELWGELFDDEDEIQAVAYIRQHTNFADPVFVGLDTHDKASWNDVRAYWLLDRPPGVFDYIFEPSLTPTPEIQRNMIAGIERNGTRWALLVTVEWEDPAFDKWPSPQAHLLDEFLAANFHKVTNFGNYVILLKNGTEH